MMFQNYYKLKAGSGMTSFIFVTGGVVSSLGKGLSAASLAAILETRGINVTMVKLDPYQLAPILAQFDPDVHEVIVMAPPQTGKSMVWRLPLLYKIRFIEGPRLIIYESDAKPEDINAQQEL